jgi:hypothetical protein
VIVTLGSSRVTPHEIAGSQWSFVGDDTCGVAEEGRGIIAGQYVARGFSSKGGQSRGLTMGLVVMGVTGVDVVARG